MQTPNTPAAPSAPVRSKAGKLLLIVIPSLILASAAGALWYAQEKKQDAADLADIQASWNAYEDATAWKTFTPDGGGFSILFPGTPLHETATDGSGAESRYDVYTSEDADGIAYSIHVAGFPNEGRPLTAEDLKRGLDSMMASDEANELVSSEATEFQGRTALDAVIDNGALRLRTRMIADGAAMIQLGAAGEWETNDGKAYEKFRDSLTLP